MGKNTDRHSEPSGTSSAPNPTKEERAHLEATNGLRQFDRLMEMLDEYLARVKERQGSYYLLRPSTLYELNRLAVSGLIPDPGAWRQVPMKITKSRHVPPMPEDVPSLVDDMCEYVNKNWNKPALHLAAYLLWRVNWIHPFVDGNGRTARAISYLVLCVRLRQRLPGDKTIPDLISDDKEPYYTGLEAADKAELAGGIDVSKMQDYLQELLVLQVTKAVGASRESTTIEHTASREEVARDSEAISRALGTEPQQQPSHLAAWISGAAGILGTLIVAGFSVSNCSKELRCVPGLQQTCACLDGHQGAQACNVDGKSFSACQCAVATTSPASRAVDAGVLVGHDGGP